MTYFKVSITYNIAVTKLTNYWNSLVIKNGFAPGFWGCNVTGFFFFFPEHLRKVPYTRNMASMTLLRVEYVLEYYVLEYHT